MKHTVTPNERFLQRAALISDEQVLVCAQLLPPSPAHQPHWIWTTLPKMLGPAGHTHLL